MEKEEQKNLYDKLKLPYVQKKTKFEKQEDFKRDIQRMKNSGFKIVSESTDMVYSVLKSF